MSPDYSLQVFLFLKETENENLAKAKCQIWVQFRLNKLLCLKPAEGALQREKLKSSKKLKKFKLNKTYFSPILQQESPHLTQGKATLEKGSEQFQLRGEGLQD